MLEPRSPIQHEISILLPAEPPGQPKVFNSPLQITFAYMLNFPSVICMFEKAFWKASPFDFIFFSCSVSLKQTSRRALDPEVLFALSPHLLFPKPLPVLELTLIPSWDNVKRG